MLFVNEMAGVADTPAFLRHVAPDVDGMTLTDLVFPAFLFITGMSIPLALGARLVAGNARTRSFVTSPFAALHSSSSAS